MDSRELQIKPADIRPLVRVLRRHQASILESIPHSTKTNYCQHLQFKAGTSLLNRGLSQLLLTLENLSYECGLDGKSYASLYLESLPQAQTYCDLTIRRAMTRSRVSLCRVDKVDRTLGVFATDVGRGDLLALPSKALARRAREGDILVARLLRAPMCWFFSTVHWIDINTAQLTSLPVFGKDANGILNLQLAAQRTLTEFMIQRVQDAEKESWSGVDFGLFPDEYNTNQVAEVRASTVWTGPPMPRPPTAKPEPPRRLLLTSSNAPFEHPRHPWSTQAS